MCCGRCCFWERGPTRFFSRPANVVPRWDSNPGRSVYRLRAPHVPVACIRLPACLGASPFGLSGTRRKRKSRLIVLSAAFIDGYLLFHRSEAEHAHGYLLLKQHRHLVKFHKTLLSATAQPERCLLSASLPKRLVGGHCWIISNVERIRAMEAIQRLLLRGDAHPT